MQQDDFPTSLPPCSAHDPVQRPRQRHMCVCGALCRAHLQLFSCSCAAELRQAEDGLRALGAKPWAPPQPRAFILMGSPAQQCVRRAGHGLSAAPSRAAAGEPGRGEGAAAQASPAGRGARAAAPAGARRRAHGRAGPAERGGRVQLLFERGRAVPVALRRVPGRPAAPAARRAGGPPPGPPLPGPPPQACLPLPCRRAAPVTACRAVCPLRSCIVSGRCWAARAAPACSRCPRPQQRLCVRLTNRVLISWLQASRPGRPPDTAAVAAPRTGQRCDGGPARAVQRVCAAGGRPQRRRRRAAPGRGPYAAARGPGSVRPRVLQPGHALPGPMG